MAYRSRGLPSAGCNLCRSKKIRCDEGKPVCGHCTRLGKDSECKYRDEFERTWRWQTDKTLEEKTKSKSRESSKSKKPAPEAPQPELSASSSSSSAPEAHVLARFFRDWSAPAALTPGVSLGWFNSLPELYAAASPDSLVHSAINTLANASYGQRFNDQKCVSEALRWAGPTLSKLREIMGSQPADDIPLREIMTSILCLGIYEALVDPDMSSAGSWVSHMGGAALFVNMLSGRGRGLTSGFELQIASMIHRQMLHGSLMTGRAPCTNTEQLRQLFPDEPKGLLGQVDLITQVASLNAEWKEAFLQNPVDPGHLVELANRGLLLEKALDGWLESLPLSAAQVIKPVSSISPPPWLQPILDAPGAPRVFHTHPALPQMMWRFHWEARMILAQALLHTHVVLMRHNAYINPVALRLDEVEANVLFFADRLNESCLSILIKNVWNTDTLMDCRIEDFPSLQGYLLLHLLPSVGLCLEQVELRGVDLTERIAWVDMMRGFLRNTFGFTKGTEKVDPSRYARCPIQLWGM